MAYKYKEQINLIDNKKYNFWLSKLFDYIPLPYPLTSFLFGILIFTIGFFISFIYDFHKIYIATPEIYLGTFGIIWVSTCLKWGENDYVNILNKIRQNYDVSDREYLDTCEKWLKPMYNDKLILSFCLFSIISVYIVVYLVYYFKIDALMVFPDEWYLPPTFYKILIIDFYGIFVLMLLATSGIVIIFNILLMNELGKKPIFFYPRIANKFKLLGEFNFKVSLTWLVGNSLILFAIYEKLNIITLPFEMLIILIGILTFFAPQFSLHKTLQKSKKDLLNKIDKSYEEQYKHMKKQYSFKDEIDIFIKLHELDDLHKNFESETKTWIYDMPSMLRLLGSSLLHFILFVSDFIIN